MEGAEYEDLDEPPGGLAGADMEEALSESSQGSNLLIEERKRNATAVDAIDEEMGSVEEDFETA